MTSPAVSRDKFHIERAFYAHVLGRVVGPRGWAGRIKEEMQG